MVLPLMILPNLLLPNLAKKSAPNADQKWFFERPNTEPILEINSGAAQPIRRAEKPFKSLKGERVKFGLQAVEHSPFFAKDNQ
jgi:hypothetical protein